MSQEIPPEVQEQIQKLQGLQNQVQSIRAQVDSLQRQLNEDKATLKEIEGLNEEVELYKAVGRVMFKSTVKQVRTEISDEVELLELKVGTLKKQEERSRKQFEELNTKLSQQIGNQ